MNERPSRDTMLVEIAQVVAKRGTCSRAQVGCVIAREGRILSIGYNGAPAGLPHCDHDTCTCGSVVSYADDCYSTCARKAPCLISVHAEANAIAFAAKHGISTDGATLFSTHGPCRPCAQLIVNSGILRLIFGMDYRDPSGLEVIGEAGVIWDRWNA